MELSNQILSDITVYMKYAKYMPELNRRETWEELVTRNKNMHIKKYPDLTILLNVSPKIGLDRKNKSNIIENRFENFENKFHDLVQEKFLELAKINDHRCRIINADNQKDFIFNEIIEHIKHFFSSNLK